jgi:hypothetical protein
VGREAVALSFYLALEVVLAQDGVSHVRGDLRAGLLLQVLGQHLGGGSWSGSEMIGTSGPSDAART